MSILASPVPSTNVDHVQRLAEILGKVDGEQARNSWAWYRLGVELDTVPDVTDARLGALVRELAAALALCANSAAALRSSGGAG